MLANIDINFGAFFLSGLLATVLGVLWYHPKVLGSRWNELRGTDSNVKTTSTPLPYIASFFLWVLAACFYAFLAQGCHHSAFIDTASSNGSNRHSHSSARVVRTQVHRHTS